jgi:cobalt-zinc-cadmium efflux system membrane fusion protein
MLFIPMLNSRLSVAGRARALLIVFLVAAVSQAVPAWAESATPGFKPSATQLAGLKIVPVVAHTFRTQYVTEGSVVADDEQTTPLFSPYSGRVVRVNAGLGDSVSRGQVLAYVDAPELVQAQNDLLAASAAVAGANAQLVQSEQLEKRRRDLYDSKAGSLQDWQQSQADLAAAQATQKTSVTGLAAVRNRLRILGLSDTETETLEKSNRVDGQAPLLAPANGVIIGRQLAPGQFIQAGATTPVFVVTDLSTVWLEASVRESDAPFVRPGDELVAEFAALPGRVFKANLNYVAPLLDPDSHRLTVRARVRNSGSTLKPGMLGRFRVVRQDASNAPAVPLSGVIHDGDQTRVWLQNPDGTLVARDIVPGRTDNTVLEVKSGLRIGEKVVAAGALFIDRAAQAN